MIEDVAIWNLEKRADPVEQAGWNGRRSFSAIEELVSVPEIGFGDRNVLWAKRREISSRGVLPSLGPTQAEKGKEHDTGHQQDRNQGRNQPGRGIRSIWVRLWGQVSKENGELVIGSSARTVARGNKGCVELAMLARLLSRERTQRLRSPRIRWVEI